MIEQRSNNDHPEYVEDTDHFCDSCGGQTVGGHCVCGGGRLPEEEY